jgi:hypothetical protein
MMKKKRSKGIIIASFILILMGLISVYYLINLLRVIIIKPTQFTIADYFFTIYGFYPYHSYLIRSIPMHSFICLSFGIGLLMLKNWIRMGLIIYFSIDIVIPTIITATGFFLSLYSKQSFELNILAELRQVLFPLIYVYYFTRPKVKEMFR